MSHNECKDDGVSTIISRISAGIALSSTKYNRNYNGKPYRPIVKLSHLIDPLNESSNQRVDPTVKTPVD